jgi:hypothetical protein
MKKIFSFLIACTAILLTGCFDAVEELTIAPDGTGVYKSTMDMGGMFDMIEMMAAMDTSQNSDLKKFSQKDVDSVASLRSVVDTATNLTAEEKKLLRDAQMSIAIRQKEKIFKIGMVYPFKKIEDVQKIMELNKSGKGVGIFGKEGKSNPALAGMGEDAAMPGLDEIFDMNYKNGLLERKLNDEKLKNFQANEKFEEMKQAKQMMESVNFTTIINLPRAATRVSGDNAKLSDNKKQVIIKTSMADLLDNPKSLAFRVEY